ncbi:MULTISPECIES: helix-turn-helix transcriptional regulator [Brevibacterium]|uniref:DeoR family transcriptional regulator n=4 Tax=Brevibacterium casei TaxID=33889 RepID=K9B0S7_9MICO|nr:WYL domain-containing protein [Brevibacterium casei]EKU47375.1 DeoR family transcriptional regulator [Brevibacterium casei S18]NJE66596.1 WYL domain-containing protein [Brevibacterium sp. LS14]QZE26351.1 WYL domain-containing protein [Brevibacterium casei]
MRADRLVSLVLLLRQRGRMSADALARELEVSTRTILRDIDALSLAGVPVFAERGRHGGFSLLPGFRTELTGLTHDEALALIASGLPRGEALFGLATALVTGMRKFVDALPESHRTAVGTVAERILVEPETDLLARSRPTEDVTPEVLTAVRLGVLRGLRLHVHYSSPGSSPRWRTVDPIGLVTSRGRGYLLGLVAGEDRTFRLDRMLAAELTEEPAERPHSVDLPALWRERSERFRSSGEGLTVTVRTDEAGATALNETAVDRSTLAAVDGGVELVVRFQDYEHAEWALWQLGPDAEVIAPDSLRDRLGEKARAMAERYG